MAWSSNETTETVSSSRSRSASSASDDCTRPSRLRMSIEPDRSTTSVTLTRGRSTGATFRAATPTRTTWVPSSRLGAIPVSALTARSVSVGAGSSYGKPLIHSSGRTDSGGTG